MDGMETTACMQRQVYLVLDVVDGAHVVVEGVIGGV